MNSYIILRGGKYIVQNNREAVKIFYKYFPDKPLFLGYSEAGKFAARFFYSFLGLLLGYFYTPFLGKIFFKKIRENNDFLIKRIGKGNWASEVRLIKEGASGRYKIIKRYKNKKEADNEILYIETYKDKASYVCFPSYARINDREIQFEFIEKRNLWIELRLGYIKKDDVELLYKHIANTLDSLYDKEECLIHGDLFPINIYIDNKTVYLIDFSDAHIYKSGYDKYVLLTCMIEASYGYVNWEIVKKYFNKSEIIYFKKYYNQLRRVKHGS